MNRPWYIHGSLALLCALEIATWQTPSRATLPTSCPDNTPYARRFVTVAPNVRLETLDWGGSGPAMILLTGLGDNAHVYDGFAFAFTDFFRVIGITRRGYGASGKPPNGYDPKTRVDDDVKVMDALNVRRAVIVGHSIAGDEISRLAIAHPDRVNALVYLDSYDYADRFKLNDHLPGAPYVEADLRSLHTFQAASARLEGIRRPLPALCEQLRYDSSKFNEKINRSITERVDYRKIAAPRLGIFATYGKDVFQPWYPYLSDDRKAQFRAEWPAIVDWQRDAIARFTAFSAHAVRPVVRRLPSAPHYIYINDVAFVVREMRTFLGIPLVGD